MASAPYKSSAPLLRAPSAADGVSVSPSAVSYTFGSWVTLIDEASSDLRLASVNYIAGTKAEFNYFEIEIGVGGAGSEVAVAAMRGVSGDSQGGPADNLNNLTLGILADVIDAGQRVSVRVRQFATSTTAWRVSIQYYALPVPAGSVMPVASVGPVWYPLRVASNTTIPLTVATGSPGSWVQITASTDAVWTITNLSAICVSGADYDIEFGTGSAGNEVPIGAIRTFDSWFFTANAWQGGPFHLRPTVPIGPIPSGVRLAVRTRMTFGGPSFNVGLSIGVVKASVSGASSMLVQTSRPTDELQQIDGVLGNATLTNFCGWVEIISDADESVPIGITGLVASRGNTGDTCFQIGIGPEDAETVIADALTTMGIFGGGRTALPLPYVRLIPANTRVAVRWACPGNPPEAHSVAVTFVRVPSGVPDFTNYIDTGTVQTMFPYPATTATAGDDPWESGEWALIEASTPQNRVLTAVRPTSPSDNLEGEIDVGIGVEGAEEVVYTYRYAAGCTPSGGSESYETLPVPFIVDEGSRLVFRARASTGGGAYTTWFHYTAEPGSVEPLPIPATTTSEIRWVRVSPTIESDGKRIRHIRLELYLQPGVGTPTGAGTNPKILVRSSDDGGFTWSHTREMTVGATGQYVHQAKLYQLGSAYRRVYEISGSGPVPYVIVKAFVDGEALSH